MVYISCVVFIVFSVVRQTESSAAAATEAAAAPPPPPPLSDAEKPVHPKIDKIANDITALNLIEVAELSELLKKRLNLPDAPVMPVGGFVAASQSTVIVIISCICAFVLRNIVIKNRKVLLN